jgi:hypothetical protein
MSDKSTSSTFSLADSSAGGPGNPPQPWISTSANSIGYDGNVLVPRNVSGGSMGPGTINASGLFINGIPIVNPTGNYVLKAGDIMHGDLLINNIGGISSFSLNSAVSGINSIFGNKDEIYRWGIRLGNNNVETGANTGSNFDIDSYTDTGVYIRTPLQIARNTGITTLLHLSLSDVSDFTMGGGLPDQFLQTNGTGILSWESIILSIGTNRIINGDFRIDQRNNGASSSNRNTYTMDRWYWGATQIDKGTWLRGASNPVLQALGFGSCWSFESSPVGYSAMADDRFALEQPIESDIVSDFAWGTPSAQPVTLSFWVYSMVIIGTFSGALRGPGNRSFPFTYQVPTINTWHRIVVTIPGDTVPSWDMSGSVVGLYVCFDYGSGSDYRSPANAWASSSAVGANGTVSIVGVANATVNMTGIKLEIGNVATPFNRESRSQSMADCQRYYQIGAVQKEAFSNGLGLYYTDMLPFAVRMRVTPTMTSNFTTQVNATGTVNALRGDTLQFSSITTVTGDDFNTYGTWTADAEL